jgi:periplasmic copper chaperone A
LKITAVLLVVLALYGAALAQAAAPLQASDAWLRATPGIQVAAVYLTLSNHGTQALSVVGVHCPLAAQAMIHETQLNGTTSSMRPHESVVVAPGSSVRLAPGGLHVMLMDLKHALQAGEEVPLELLLSDGSKVAVTAHVRALVPE